MEPILKKSTIPLNNIHKSILPQIPPWIIIKNPKVNLQLNQLHKTKTHPFTYQEKHQNILQQHPDYLCIYTDGSKDNNKTECAAVLNKIIKTKTLPMESSIFTAETCAIDLTLDIISAQSNTFSLSVKFLMIPESTISMQIPWRTYLRTSTWIMFCRSWKRPGCTRKYRLGYNPENTTN